MLKVKNIRKEYTTGGLHQTALNTVSLNLRDSEFVAILGPSGSGKTTLLNIIGGLDRYDSGDLIINGVSTRDYRDRDWDSYRNHTVGFVFQSYNLIPHQTIMSNVELALTISGMSSEERRKRASEALDRVGLGDQLHKKPNQLSGGQMQRVAIARALVNDPDILLADEPTGALDTGTSRQIMELLKEVAGDRLVVMVTHNPELAGDYATRIVRLKDGSITDDSDPFFPEETSEAEHCNPGRTSMSFATALGLSFNNLKTKKIRTLLTAFSGSIGIIGIALIMSLSNGVNSYINNIQEDTLSEYPLTIFRTDVDLSAMMKDAKEHGSGRTPEKRKKNDAEVLESRTLGDSLSRNRTNDLGSLKEFLSSGKSRIYDYANAVEYKYNITPNLFMMKGDSDYRRVNPDDSLQRAMSGIISTQITGDVSGMRMMAAGSVFQALPESDSLYKRQYEVKAGRWPKGKFECVAVLSQDGTFPDLCLYALGLKDTDELDEMLKKYEKEENVSISGKPDEYRYDDFIGIRLKLVNSTEYYEYDRSLGIYVNRADDRSYMLDKVKAGDDLTIVGVVQPTEETGVSMLNTGVAYSPQLERYIMNKSAESEVVKRQLENTEVNVFTGKKFGEDGGVDMDSLFYMDRNALKSAFKFDPTAFRSMDFSDIKLDMSNISIDLSKVTIDPKIIEGMDFNSLIGSLDVAVSDEELSRTANRLMKGFLRYIASDPNTGLADLKDPSKLSSSIMAYMQTPEAQKIIREDIGKIVDTDALEKAIQKSLASASNRYIQKALTKALSGAGDDILKQLGRQISGQVGRKIATQMQNAVKIDPDAFANAFQINLDGDTINGVFASMIEASQSDYEDNLRALNYADEDSPYAIYIYPKDFKDKTEVVKILNKYNDDMRNSGRNSRVITFSDTVATLMGSVTEIVDTISYVLIAFVAISLIVSSIMIGIITYISVLERTKEIGILRAIGASKRNISQVFNAETFITGLLAGIIGIAVSLSLLLPLNAFIHAKLNASNVVASLPFTNAVLLVFLSIILTLIGGFIPSRTAARKDPVAALRAE